MQTNKLYSRLARAGARLVMLASMLMAALLSSATPAFALPRVSAVSVAAQVGTATAGTAGSVTYVVTVSHVAGSGTLTAGLSVTSGLPAGATASFSPATVSFTNAQTTQTSNLTIATTAATPAVTAQSFTVRAARTIAPTDLATGNGSLTVKASQAISFGALANKTTADPDFNVSATGGGSGNPVTFTATGACTVTGTLVHLTGAGSCTITAHQAGNATYGDAPDVSQTFAITVPAGPTVTLDLYAVTGTTTLPGPVSVPTWGYTTDGSAVSKPGGPVLVVNQNENVVVNLHNQLSESTALLFQGQNMIPDTAGVSAGASTSYTFVASKPGTFLYEAGLMRGAQHQVAMGLYGALIVRPAGFAAVPGQAYAGSASAFNTEQVLLLGELDTALNGSSTPSTFDMRKYAPKYYLINGQAYPNTPAVPTTAGDKVLLRYVNAGLQAHAMSTLGLSQSLVGQDGRAMAYPHAVVAETIAPGQTLDAIVTIPASAALGAQFPLYDASLFLRNNKGTAANAGLGGMLTFLKTETGSTSGDDTTGPLLASLTLTPNPSNGAADVALAFTANDTTTGNSNIAAAEYWVDGNATHTAIPLSGSPAPIKSFAATIAAPFTHGTHVVSVRAQDAVGNWSATANLNLVVDSLAPTTSGLSLTPNPSNGSVGVTFAFTGNDSATGNSNITAAEYWVDAGAHQPLSVVSPAPVTVLSVGLTPPFSAGTHTVSARTQDALGNWSLPASINLVVDQTGPATVSVSASPNPNNGSTPFNSSVPAVRVVASFSDASTGNSNLANAEGFLDAAGTTGTGFVFIANDGNFNSPAESGYADIPLAVVNALSTGAHPICVHAKDAPGNWGAVDCSYSLTIDKLAPTVSSIARADANPAGNGSVRFLVTFSESVSGVTASNFSVVRTGLAGTSSITSVTGSAAAWTVTVTTGSGAGTLGLNLTSAAGISDLAGNPMASTGLPFVGQVYTIQPPPQPALYFSTLGNTNPSGVAGTADDADIYFYSGSAFSRNIDVTAITSPLPASANVDGFDRVDATHFYMSFNGAVAVPGLGTVQDEDVVFYNAGTWSLFFDGSVNGVTSNLDAISIVGGNLYFSLSTTTVPPGAGGTGDDADIYRWNGGSSYTRVVDASGAGSLGLPAGANVDGFVWVDATHYYMSFADPVTLPGGAGTAQDEDVVYYNNGSWSIYFDGSVLGMDTSNNLDIDAFDLP